MKNYWYLLTLFLFLSACNQPQQVTVSQPEPIPETFKPAKNIILMIGDGMGITQITAGLYSNENRLNLERFPVVGLHKSYSSNNLITDSAAGATAFSCGEKTYNGAIGVGPDSLALPTILEEAEAKNLATGLIATSTIVHATPASFIAHQVSRKMYPEIAADFLNTEIDLLIGGGLKYFTQREDDRNLVSELSQKGYNTGTYFDRELNEMPVDSSLNFAYWTSNNDPLPVNSGRDYLVPASALAPSFLDKHNEQKGFFLMIEGSQIDWGGHANDSEYIISEMLDFDQAIGKVLAFAEGDGETLVIVTADHETGGYAINPGSKMGEIKGSFTSGYHTAALIPVFAYGPGAELFAGIYENTAIYHKMRDAYGWTLAKKEPKTAPKIK
ncbi:MAG: alkaline phosphatase [Bacteroidota bacterium]